MERFQIYSKVEKRIFGGCSFHTGISCYRYWLGLQVNGASSDPSALRQHMRKDTTIQIVPHQVHSFRPKPVLLEISLYYAEFQNIQKHPPPFGQNTRLDEPMPAVQVRSLHPIGVLKCLY